MKTLTAVILVQHHRSRSQTHRVRGLTLLHQATPFLLEGYVLGILTRAVLQGKKVAIVVKKMLVSSVIIITIIYFFSHLIFFVCF